MLINAEREASKARELRQGVTQGSTCFVVIWARLNKSTNEATRIPLYLLTGMQ